MHAPMATAGLVQTITRETALLRCVLVSIVLHALVLLGISVHESPAPPSKALLALTARLVPFAAAPQAPVQAMPLERPRPKSSEPASAPSQAPAKPLVSLPPVLQNTAPAESARAVEPEPVLASSSAENSSGQPAPAQVRPVPQRVGGAPGADAAGKSGTEADAGTLDQYRLALIVATRRYKRYPAIAMEKGWQGRVEVRMVIGADGMMLHASIKAGSGYDVLDNQALDMLKKGKTTVPIPLGLRGREFSIDVPVIFNLDSPNS